MLTNINMLKNLNKLIPAGTTVIVAVSGGADSVCLLYSFADVRDELGINLEACHVNHMLRGENSDDDEIFVRALCDKLGVKLHVKKIDVMSMQKKHQSLEECGREARYSYFDELGTDVIIATAHTANDNTETVLLNLLRGTALKGLCGIPHARDNIVRPLIKLTRADVLNYLNEKKADYKFDESNNSKEFTRNYLRLSVIPSLENINPSLNNSVSRMCEALKRDEEYLHDIAITELKGIEEENGEYDAHKLANLHLAIQSRIISMILSKNNISPSDLRIRQVSSIIETGGKVNLVKDKFAVSNKISLRVETVHQNYRIKTQNND